MITRHFTKTLFIIVLLEFIGDKITKYVVVQLLPLGGGYKVRAKNITIGIKLQRKHNTKKFVSEAQVLCLMKKNNKRTRLI